MSRVLQSASKLLNQIAAPRCHLQNQVSFAAPPTARARAAATEQSELSDNDDGNQNVNPRKKWRRSKRSRISFSTIGRENHGEWSCEFWPTLRDLQLDDLAEEGHEDSEVFVELLIQKHSGFGFTINGRIKTSFNRKCRTCFSSYCKEIDTNFDVCILPASSKRSEHGLPAVGGIDPSVMYVKQGSQANLDSVVQDNIRLTTSDTCSEACESPTIIWQTTEGRPQFDRSWVKLLELKKRLGMQNRSQSTENRQV